MTPEEQLRLIRQHVEHEAYPFGVPEIVKDFRFLLAELDRVTAERARDRAIGVINHEKFLDDRLGRALHDLCLVKLQRDEAQAEHGALGEKYHAALAELARRDVSSAMSPDVLVAQRDDALAQVEKLRLALRNVRGLAKRLRKTDSESAAHFLRFIEEAGVTDSILREAAALAAAEPNLMRGGGDGRAEYQSSGKAVSTRPTSPAPATEDETPCRLPHSVEFRPVEDEEPKR